MTAAHFSPVVAAALAHTQKAQTKDQQSQPSQSPSDHQDNSLAPATSSSCPSSPSQIHNHSIRHITATADQDSQQQQQHHHLQILGNHPVSPVPCTFLDLPADPFMPTRANHMLFPECEYEQDYPVSTPYENTSFLHYATTAPVAEDCQSSSEHLYSQQRIKSEFSNEYSVMAPSYMMNMTRSFSDSQLSDICEGSGISPFDQTASAGRDMEMCDSPLVYSSGQSHGSAYDDDYYTMSGSHHPMSSHPSLHGHRHSLSYSTSSLSTLSEDMPMSPRSPFSSMHASLSMSNSCSSMTSAYPLSRTLSEPVLPLFQSMTSPLLKHASATGVTNPNAASTGHATGIKPTPKRSRGRRVSCNPDTTGGCKVFTCRFEDCGKIFKRSEHLKRHVRSIHTLEKPFECPIQSCPKRFSRSDNLNQHIRIHRHSSRGEKSKAYAAFTPFLQNYSTELVSLT